MDAAQLAQWTSSARHRGPKHDKMYIPRHQKHRIVACLAFVHFCWSKLAIFLCIICNLQAKIRPSKQLSFNSTSKLWGCQNHPPNFHLYCTQLPPTSLLAMAMARPVTVHHVLRSCMATLPGLVQGLKKPSNDLLPLMEFWGFCSCSVYCWDATSLITLVGGGPCACEENLEPRHVFPLLCATGPRIFIPVLEDEIGNWQVARDLGHSEVNQLVIGMDCSWQSTISILIFSDIRWYAMLPNDIFYYNIPNLRDLVLDAVSTSWHRNAARTQHWRQYSSTTSFSDSKSRGKWPRRIKEKSLLGLWHYPLGAYCMTGSVVASFTRTQPTTKQHVRRPTSGCQGQQDNPETLNCQWCSCAWHMWLPPRGVVNAMAPTGFVIIVTLL